jgi:hypothetical protein
MLPEPEFSDWVWTTQKPATKDEFVEMLFDNDLYEQFLEEQCQASTE